MADIANLQIKVDTAQVKTANRDLDALSKTSNKAESASKQLTSTFISMRGALASLGIGISAAQIISLADSYTVMQSKLGLVTESMEELASVQERLLQIANEQRKPVTEVTELYVKAATAAKELGASQEDVFKFTEGVSAALTVNGTTTQAAAGALLQLGQAIGGTKIQMQEYNSLIDGARPLLQAIADNMDKAGGSVNKLTQLVRDGKVTSQEFFAAAVKGSEDLTEKASKMEVTVSQAITIIGNKMLTYVGYANDATDATNNLSQAIIDFSESSFLKTAFEAIAVTALNVKYTFTQIGNEIGGIAAQFEALSRLDFTAFRDIREQMLRDARIAREQVDLQSENILNPLRIGVSEPASAGNKPRIAPEELSEEELKELAKKNEKIRQAHLNLKNDLLEMDKKYLKISNDTENRIIEESRKSRDEASKRYLEIEQRRADENFAEAQRLAKGTADEWKDAFADLKQAVDGYSRDMSRSLAQFALGGKVSFADMIDNMLLKLLEFANQKLIFDPLFKSISGAIDAGSASGGGLGGFLSGAIGSLFGSSNSYGSSFDSSGNYTGGFFEDGVQIDGSRASGGSVSAGKNYIVGEKGMELFSPSTNGTIIPNNQLSSKTNVTVNVIEAQGTKANIQQTQNPDGTMSINVIIEQLYGAMNRDIQRGTGIAPTLERRYGLNRVAGAY